MSVPFDWHRRFIWCMRNVWRMSHGGSGLAGGWSFREGFVVLGSAEGRAETTVQPGFMVIGKRGCVGRIVLVTAAAMNGTPGILPRTNLLLRAAFVGVIAVGPANPKLTSDGVVPAASPSDGRTAKKCRYYGKRMEATAFHRTTLSTTAY
jgi:hypothetical protein